MRNSIALIGFMGTGKTAVGKLLAERLHLKFIEMDSIIEHKAGKSIPQIFQQDGEIGFRELEIDVAKEIAGEQNTVIACGGGIVLNRINIDRLRTGSVMVHLTASPAVILKRTMGDSNVRPLLNVSDPVLRIKELLKFRRPLYERAADITINTSRLSLNSVVEQIINKLKEDASFHFQE
jgi:shikimate kinase